MPETTTVSNLTYNPNLSASVTDGHDLSKDVSEEGINAPDGIVSPTTKDRSATPHATKRENEK